MLFRSEPLSRRVLLILLALLRQGFQHPHLQAVVGNYTAILQEMGLSKEDIQSKIQALVTEATGANI